MTELPQPAQWRDRDFVAAAGIALFGASAAVAALWTFQRFERGDHLTAAITAGGTIFAACCALLAVRGRFMRTPLRAKVDRSGTKFLPDAVGVILVITLCVAAIPSGLLFVVFAPQHRVDLPISDGERVFEPILVGALVFFAAVGLIAIVRRRGTGHLLLTPDGFELVDVLFTQRGSWQDVEDVSDVAADKQVRHPIVLVMKDGKPIVVKNADGYAPNGAALYWLIRYYWRHPENRAELADGRAVKRLCDEELVAE
ncbi:hypothetical protein [Mycolicibacterium goodii]|uniref:hypothetical protein n=1 Tax=Mycolicibacterium goodii TaxID=134601 RepID=UPI00296E68B8